MFCWYLHDRNGIIVFIKKEKKFILDDFVKALLSKFIQDFIALVCAVFKLLTPALCSVAYSDNTSI